MPTSERGRKATAMALWGGITMLVGWAGLSSSRCSELILQGFMRFTTPTQDQIYARLSPELRRQYDREHAVRRAQNDSALQQVFDQRNLDRPAWRTDAVGLDGEKQQIPLSKDCDVPDEKKTVRR